MSIKDFILLSNSKFMGQETCKLLNKNNFYDIDQCIKAITFDYKADLNKYENILRNEKILILENILPNILNPPMYLYCKGKGVVLDKRVAIIGARECSHYGKKIAYKLGHSFASKGFTVVSGMAKGIDASAHQGALDADGSTIAVLGSGILNCYPKSNEKLYAEIIKKGKVISEYGLYGKPMKHHFPFRNRLISGLAQVVIVVEAKKKSGTMITVRCALEQGKTVYAVPGPVDSTLSQGTHKLIDDGAQIFISVEEMMKEWPNFE